MYNRLILALLIIVANNLLGQEAFQIPRTADGRILPCEKFEMIEKYYNHWLSHNEDENTDHNPSSPREFTSLDNREIQVGFDGESESELHAAVNPTDPNNIIVGVISFDMNNRQRPIAIATYVTYDGGEIWAETDLSLESHEGLIIAGGDPIVTYDVDGVAYLSYLIVTQSNDGTIEWGMFAQRSLDGGVLWTPMEEPIALEVAPGFIEIGAISDKQWMASDLSETSPYRGNVYVTYTLLDVQTDSIRIAFKRKQSVEESFSLDSVIISQVDDNLIQFSNIEVDNNSNIHVVYLADVDARLDVYTAFLTTSTDGGLSFSEPQEIAEVYFPDFGERRLPIPGVNFLRKYPCPQLAIDRSRNSFDGRIYFTYTGFGSESLDQETTDIYLIYSEDNGQTWSAPITVNNDGDLLTHQFYPSITVTDQGDVALAWYDRRDYDEGSTETEYYLGFSEDGGESFENIKVSQEPSDFAVIGALNTQFGIGEYNEIVSTNGYMMPFWADGRNNDGSIAVYTYLFNKDISSTDDFPVPITSEVQMTTPNPNPAKDEFSFSIVTEENQKITATLIDNQGQLIKPIFSAQNLIGTNDYNVDASAIPSGSYILNVSWKNSSISKKIIIQ